MYGKANLSDYMYDKANLVAYLYNEYPTNHIWQTLVVPLYGES